jgi:phage shock protein C
MIKDCLQNNIALLRRIRRNNRRGMIAGVCAGLAAHFNIDVNLLRFGWVIGAFMTGFFPFTFVYLALWYLLDPLDDDRVKRPSDAPQSAERPTRSADLSPLMDRFARLEERLRGMEACASSREFQLRREIDKL